jgi:CRP-like cAMP-binding protein
MGKIETIAHPPEHFVVTQGDDPDFMYILKDGEMAVKVQDENNVEAYVNIPLAGSQFGEVSLISSCKRTATVECLNYCILAQLSSLHFKEMCKLFPDVLKKMKEKRSTYNDMWKQFLRRLVLDIPYFKNLESNTIEELIYSLVLETHNEDDVIKKSGGEIGKLMYITEGEVKVMI